MKTTNAFHMFDSKAIKEVKITDGDCKRAYDYVRIPLNAP